MSISIICSRCNTPYTLPGHFAGKTVVCKKCNALLDVPDAGAPKPVLPATAGTSRYDRIVGKPPPLFFDILGLHTRWEEEFSTRDIMRLIWSLYHLVLFFVVITVWTRFAGDPHSAAAAAPCFLLAALVILTAGLFQMRTIAQHIAPSLAESGPRHSSLMGLLSSLPLVVTEPRAALPAIRTFFLAIVALFASFSLASKAGGWSSILPIHALPSFMPSQPSDENIAPPPSPLPAPPPVAAPPATAPAAPAPPPEDEKPLPPPEENTPAAPPDL